MGKRCEPQVELPFDKALSGKTTPPHECLSNCRPNVTRLSPSSLAARVLLPSARASAAVSSSREKCRHCRSGKRIPRALMRSQCRQYQSGITADDWPHMASRILESLEQNRDIVDADLLKHFVPKPREPSALSRFVVWIRTLFGSP
jgi:hypothetical protein